MSTHAAIVCCLLLSRCDIYDHIKILPFPRTSNTNDHENKWNILERAFFLFPIAFISKSLPHLKLSEVTWLSTCFGLGLLDCTLSTRALLSLFIDSFFSACNSLDSQIQIFS